MADFRWVMLVTWLMLSEISTVSSATEQKICTKDETLPDRFDFNVYYCPGNEAGADTDKTECCEVDSKFTCCIPKIEHIVEEQAILWGSLGGSIALIALLCICYHKDSRCCDPGRPCCPCCSRRHKEEKTLIVNNEEFLDPADDMAETKTDMPITAHHTDEDSGRGSGCSSPSSPSFARTDSAKSARSAERSARPQQLPAPVSARSQRMMLSAKPGPSRIADIQL